MGLHSLPCTTLGWSLPSPALPRLHNLYRPHSSGELQSHTETFTTVSLPADILVDCFSVTFVAKGELLLQQEIVRWKIESEAHFRVSVTNRKCWSLQPPLLVGTEVYCQYREGGEVEFGGG